MRDKKLSSTYNKYTFPVNHYFQPRNGQPTTSVSGRCIYLLEGNKKKKYKHIYFFHLFNLKKISWVKTMCLFIRHLSSYEAVSKIFTESVNRKRKENRTVAEQWIQNVRQRENFKITVVEFHPEIYCVSVSEKRSNRYRALPGRDQHMWSLDT